MSVYTLERCPKGHSYVGPMECTECADIPADSQEFVWEMLGGALPARGPGV